MANAINDIKEGQLYTWPNDAFPFRCFLNHPKVRIFILENISHNYKWLKSQRAHIRNSDFFFVQLGWNFSSHLALHARFTIDSLGLNKENFYIMYNDSHEESQGYAQGFNGCLINHNAWLDENAFKILDIEKKYNASYIARQNSFKRHNLACKVPDLALIAGGDTFGGETGSLPDAVNNPFKKLNKAEIIKIINQSGCGLALSKEEGASYSSSEYLLCGVPIVSTFSDGGRDVWYNTDNSIICNDTPEAVQEAVCILNDRKVDPQRIRDHHIGMAKLFRHKFIAQAGEVFKKYGIKDTDPLEYFYKDFSETHSSYRQYVHCSSLAEVESFFK